MTEDNKGSSFSNESSQGSSEQPGERVNEITPTNTPEPAPDPSRNDTVHEPEGTTEDDQEGTLTR